MPGKDHEYSILDMLRPSATQVGFYNAESDGFGGTLAGRAPPSLHHLPGTPPA